MKLTYHMKFYEQFLPPRCRKYRSRETSDDFSVELSEVTGEQAPVAIRQQYRRDVVEYRWHKEKLYVQCRLSDFTTLRSWPGNKQKRNRLATVKDIYVPEYGSHLSKEKAAASLLAKFEKYVLIDGKLHQEIGEPRYVVMTFGLGCNHGLGWGTSISVDHHYNSNIGKNNYYRIDQEEQARADGREIAARRGDTKASPHFDKRLYERFTILIPEAVRLNPQVEHGDGCPFINRVNKLTEMKNPTIAGLMMMAEVFRP